MHGETTTEIRHGRRTQINMLRNWLSAGKKVDATIAREQMGIGHLPRRILDLKDEGMNIQSRYVKYKRRFDGLNTHIKEYWMAQDQDDSSIQADTHEAFITS